MNLKVKGDVIMAITASLVKELRERTGAGMMECKKALEETNGDIEVAIENMRKSGQAKAAKKAGRIAADGVIKVAIQLTVSLQQWLKLTVKLTSLLRTRTSNHSLMRLLIVH